jgi:micrococcal nuclease
VRLLLVDTPETVHPDKPIQPFGAGASAFAKQSLSGQNIKLEIGQSKRDKYDRLLAYVYADGNMFNKMLLKKGLARVAYIYPPNTKYVDEFKSIQKQAKQNALGIWSIKNYVQNDGFNYNVYYDPDGKDRNCSDFNNRIEAQGFFILAGGPGNDSHRLDGDNDNKACEGLPIK